MKKWILRLLIVLLVAMCFFLFALKIVSGTGDAQKRGLEQAFSEIFQGQASFGQLRAFNIFPQLSLGIDKFVISNIQGRGELFVNRVDLAFGPMDVLAKRRKIEAFHVEGLEASEGLYTPLSLSLTDAGIYKGAQEGGAVFSFSGMYGTQALKGSVDMVSEGGMRPKYAFGAHNPFTVNIGAVQITGVFTPYVVHGSQVNQIRFGAKTAQNHQSCTLPTEKTLSLLEFFKDVVGQVSTLKSSKDFDIMCKKLGSS